MSMPQLEAEIHLLGGGTLKIIARDPAGGLPGLPGETERHLEFELDTQGVTVHFGTSQADSTMLGVQAIQGAGYLAVP